MIVSISKIYFKGNFKLQQIAKDNKIPVYIINNNTVSQITNVLKLFIELGIRKFPVAAGGRGTWYG